MAAHLTKPIDELEFFKTLARFIVPKNQKPERVKPPDSSEQFDQADKPIDIERALGRLSGRRDRFDRLSANFLRVSVCGESWF